MTAYEFTLQVSGRTVRRLARDYPRDPNMQIPVEVQVRAGEFMAELIGNPDDPGRVVNIRGPFLAMGGDRGRQQDSIMNALGQVDTLRREVADLERSQNEFVDEALKDAPRCWDGDEAAESLALDYLRHLEAATAAGNIADELTRHRDGCDGGC